MKRREFLIQSALAAAATGVASASAGAQAQTKSPNFVFILIDDLGWPDLGCYGHQFHETPNCDRLAAEGMRFTDAYAACPVCSPTRASIVAGQYPARVGITDFITGHWRPYEKLRVPINRTQFLPHDTVTFAEALDGAGYTCGMYGKWHLGGRDSYPDSHGFDEMGVRRGNHVNFSLFPEVDIPDDPYMSEVLTDEAEKFLERHQDDPFCLCLHHYAVHIPLQARQRLIEKYENKPKPESGVNHPVYAAMVEHVDESVGRIMDKLDALDLSDNTVVVFFSDNGGLRQRFDGDGPVVSTNAPLRDEKGTLYEGGIRVPLIVRWPGEVAAGSECAAPVTSVDFYPTFLELAGVSPPAEHALDGESLVTLLRGGDELERDAIYWHYPHYHHSSPAGVIRQGDYKLIEFFEDRRVELYNLRDDIGETNDLADTQRDRARTMQQALADWRKSVDAAMPSPNTDHDPDRAHEWGRHPDRG